MSRYATDDRGNTCTLNLTMPCYATDDRGATLAHSIWAMPRYATDDRGATPAYSIWPCLAVQALTKGQHRHTQSGHALLCKR